MRALTVAAIALLLAACRQTSGPTSPTLSASHFPTAPSVSATAAGTPAAARGLEGTGKIVGASQSLSFAQSKGGEFSIAIPAGWMINPSQDGQTFNITVQGQADPKIYIVAAIPVSDLRADEAIIWCVHHTVFDVVSTCTEPELLDHLQDANHQWAAADAFQALIQFDSMVNGNRYGTPQLTSPSQTSVHYAVSVLTPAGASLVQWGLVAMGYMSNPAFNGTTSLAFVTGCEASRDQYQTLQATCDRAFATFHPSQTWLSNLAARQMQSYNQELRNDAQQIAQNAQLLQAISNFGSAMQQMQQQEFNSLEQTDRRVGEDWIATLGGDANMQDPSTGNVYLVDGGYAGYCISNLGNIMESQSSMQRGEYFGTDTSESCDRIMQSPSAS